MIELDKYATTPCDASADEIFYIPRASQIINELAKVVQKEKEQAILNKLEEFGHGPFKSKQELEDFAKSRLKLIKREEDQQVAVMVDDQVLFTFYDTVDVEWPVLENKYEVKAVLFKEPWND